ncbi:OmpA family protein [Roseivivax marinus]|uniref:OmpA family protein n=1 Tax=Roseivivax marinus TaxID=1379903 RepID=UPI001F045B8C|nr:OmpA family protein [Roseivivax marinus]UMA65762.1 OmpA family protein [Roseivivax marinus]
MTPNVLITTVLSFAMLAGAAHAQDIEGASDHPVIGRYDGSIITHFEQAEYDAQTIFTSIDPEGYETLEGAVTRIVYTMPEGASALQVARSFEQTLTADGFEILVSCRNRDCGRALFGKDLRSTTWLPFHAVGSFSSGDTAFLTAVKDADGASIHAQIAVADAIRRLINVNVVESAAFENKVLDAAAMAESISETGRVALDNIYFDTNEATLTPESDAALAEMAKLLSDNPDVDVYIVGHTDTVGGYDFNLDLSRRRAQAVVDALVGSHGVSADRVVPAGVGPLAPVASNATGDGQARNRRVELVER